jgi:hypothetical protein
MWGAKEMHILRKFPALSVLLLVVGYAVFGWLLSIHKDEQLWLSIPKNTQIWFWIGTGAISVAVSWWASLAWAITVVILVFSKQSQFLGISIGIAVVWALVMYVARTEVKAFVYNRVAAFIVLILLATGGMTLGVYADLSLIRSFGESVLQIK